MNALEAFAGGALLGGLETYGKIGDEQRKFKIDQMKQEAEYQRQLNLQRAGHGLKEVAVGQDGMPLTREQLEGMTPEERANVQSKEEYQKGFGNSGMLDKATGRPLTTAEYEAMTPEQRAQTISKDFLDNQQALARQNAGIAAADARANKRQLEAEGREAARITAAEKKVESQKEAAIETELKTRRTNLIDEADKTAAAYRKNPDQFGEFEAGTSLSTVKKVTLVDNLMSTIKTLPQSLAERLVKDSLELQEAGKIAIMANAIIQRKGKISTEEVQQRGGDGIYADAMDYLTYTGQKKTVEKGSFWWKEQETVYGR